MTIFIYICIIVGLVVSGIALFLEHKFSGRFFGRTLSQWVCRTRGRDDEISAEKLKQVRKRLEALAHDVLKHRLLGLHSLLEEMRPYYDPVRQALPPEERRNPTPEQDMAFRDEFFRICGIKLSAEDRLWTKWFQAFQEIAQYTGKFVSTLPADPMFAVASLTMIELRRILVRFVRTERSWQVMSKRFLHLTTGEFTKVYPEVLNLADACRMIVDPEAIVRSAVAEVSSQAQRSEALGCVRVLGVCKGRYLCAAPQKTLTMSLVRLLDNALCVGKSAAVEALYLTDDFTGATSLLFKVYDESERIPATSEYGMGMRGVRQSLEAFEGGVQFRPDNRDAFKKCAVVSISASPYRDMRVTKLRPVVVVAFGAFCFMTLVVFLGCVLFIIGGPPVQFAGEGTSIVEFSVAVGETLDIPLCTGGRNVRAEITAVNSACSADNCTFGHALEAVQPCSSGLKKSGCSGVFHWTPTFEDGQRQGRNYEILIACIADGPPRSEDARRIRVLVTRPNSAPQILLAQVINETRGETHYVKSDQTIKVGVTDELHLRVLAGDADADVISYQLKLPDGKILSSSDGQFDLKSSWSMFATSTFELSVTDNVSPPITMPIVLEADALRPIELQRIEILSSNSAMRIACDGTGESHVCHLPARSVNEITMRIAFDPLQPKIRPLLQMQLADNRSVGARLVRAHGTIGEETRVGDQWEFYLKQNQQIVAITELTNIERSSVPGVYHFTFRILTNVASSESFAMNQVLTVSVDELSHRMPEARSFVIFSYLSESQSPLSFSSRHIQLTEFDAEEDARYAASSIWVYANNVSRTMGTPKVRRIACQTPEFSQAFDTTGVRTLKNAWRLDFKLKRGCIPGLAPSLAGKQRLCTATLEFGDESLSEDIWIMLEDRACSPRIESLTLAPDAEDSPAGAISWRFRIVDTDGDLLPEHIAVQGNSKIQIDIVESSHVFGDVYLGELRMAHNCQVRSDARIELIATDNAGLSVRKPIPIPQNCPPLVNVASGETRFTVEEGAVLSIPLLHAPDVTPVLTTRFGQIQNDTFTWRASCSYGKGPHVVEIASLSDSRYGEPLRLELFLHCQPRFSFSLDGAPLASDMSVGIHPGQKRRLALSTDYELDDLEIIPQMHGILPRISISIVEEYPTYQMELECNEAGISEELRIQILSAEGAGVTRVEPIVIPIQCLEE